MSRCRGWAVVLLALAATLALTAPARAATKPYSIVICALGSSESCAPSPTSAANAPAGIPTGATSVPMTAIFKNDNKLGTGINLGSANLTPPAGFTVTSPPSISGCQSCSVSVVGNVVEVRGAALPPGSAPLTVSMTVSVGAPQPVCTVAVPCVWSVLSKQSNDFSGSPGNNLTVDNKSTLNTVFMALQFGAEPRNELLVDPVTGLPDPITDSDYNPPAPNGTGGPVTVETVDANGTVVPSYVGPITLTPNTPLNMSLNPNPAMLSGTNPKHASGGVATFADLTLNEPGNGYTLTASTSDVPAMSASSTAFDAQQAGAQCTGNKSCNTKAHSANFANTNGGVLASITAGSGSSTDLAESLDFGNHLSAAQCENYDAAHDVYWNLDSTSGRIVQVAITTTVLSGNISGSLINGQDNCLSAPNEFTEINEMVTPATLQDAPMQPQPDGTMGFSGLLPNCGSKKLEVSPATNPCVVSRTGMSNPLGGGTLTITISVPASLGDMTSRG